MPPPMLILVTTTETVICCRFSTSSVMQGMSEVVAYGTAMKLA